MNETKRGNNFRWNRRHFLDLLPNGRKRNENEVESERMRLREKTGQNRKEKVNSTSIIRTEFASLTFFLDAQFLYFAHRSFVSTQSAERKLEFGKKWKSWDFFFSWTNEKTATSSKVWTITSVVNAIFIFSLVQSRKKNNGSRKWKWKRTKSWYNQI